MQEKKQKKNRALDVEERAEALAAPIAEQLGNYIYDVEYVKEGKEFFLNIYIDRDGGVTVNDCEAVSRLVSDELDRQDFIRDPYTLVVSSPGLGRALTKDRHLDHSIGQDVELHLFAPHPETGEKDMRGELISYSPDQIVLFADPPAPARKKERGKKEVSPAAADAPEGRQERMIERKSIASIRLAFDF